MLYTVTATDLQLIQHSLLRVCVRVCACEVMSSQAGNDLTPINTITPPSCCQNTSCGNRYKNRGEENEV